MPPGPEAKIERWLRTKVHAMGGVCWKWTAPGFAGVPDRVIVFRGRVIFVELKADKGRVRPLQHVRIEQLRAAGADARIVRGRAEAEALVAELAAMT